MIKIVVDDLNIGHVHIDQEDPDELLEHIVVFDEVLIKYISPETLHKLIDIAVERDGAEITEEKSIDS